MVRASVLVALATTGGVPKKSSVGNVTSVPPPATALIAPAAIAAAANPKISNADMVDSSPSLHRFKSERERELIKHRQPRQPKSLRCIWRGRGGCGPVP